MIIIFEGIDGCGKTTQTKLLANYLCQKKVKYIIFKEPVKPFRSLILNNKFDPLVYFFLFQANRAFNFNQIRKYLQKKYWILIDRSFPSTFAYQWYLTELKDKIDLKLLETINRLVTYNLDKLTKVLIFDVPAKVAYRRIKKENVFEQKPLRYFQKLRRAYLNLAIKFKWQIINGNNDPLTVHQEVKNVLKLK